MVGGLVHHSHHPHCLHLGGGYGGGDWCTTATTPTALTHHIYMCIHICVYIHIIIIIVIIILIVAIIMGERAW